MPFLEDGTVVDILFNTLGVVNRLISAPLYEVDINFTANRVRDRINILPTIEEKENLLMKFLSFFDDRKMYSVFKDYYEGLSDIEKVDFYKEINITGLFVNLAPMWEVEVLFDRMARIYDTFPWIEKYDVYVNKFDRKIKIMEKLVVGEQYILKMKQTSKKGFSARSMGFINIKGLPDKTNRSKNNLQLYSTTPIKIGADENNNMGIAVDSKTIAELHLVYRNSVVGRREVKKLLTKNILKLKKFKIKHEYKNRNVEILNSYMKSLGLAIVFPGDSIYIDQETDEIECFMYDNNMFLMTKKEMREEIINLYFKKKFDEKIFIGSDEDYAIEFARFKEHEMNKRRTDITYIYHESQDW